MAAFEALTTIVRVHLGDGVARAKPGEILEHTDAGSARDWVVLSGTDEDIPAHPPNLAPGKVWHILGSDQSDEGTVDELVVEERNLHWNDFSEDAVVVFREGLAFPTRELLWVVNNAHAVLVLRGKNNYFYLHDGFVMSAREEEALVEWGVGRPLFANYLLAVGGTVLVAFVEKIWGPAVVGTLLVAAAGYRVQGVMTKVLRIRSPEWTSRHKLIPSGIHGTERVVQGVLLTLVALADLLDDRWLLLAALTLASVQVVVLEYLGQASLTWGRDKFNNVLRIQLRVWTVYVAGLVAWLWLSYVFAGFFFCILVGVDLIAVLGALRLCFDRTSIDYHTGNEILSVLLILLGSSLVGVWLSVLGWNDADLKFTPQSLQPWRWPLFRRPDSLSTYARIVGLWFSAVGGLVFAVFIAVGVFSCRTSSDGNNIVELGERTREREEGDSRGFSHYHTLSIPSRNLLVPDVLGSRHER